MNVSLAAHPTDPWRTDLAPGEKLIITASDLKYRDALSANSRLELESSTDGKQLRVELQGEVHFPVLIGGSEGISGTLQNGEHLTLGKYAWIFRVYASGQGAGLEPIDPLPGVSLLLKDVKVGDRLNIPHLHIPAGQSVAIIGRSGAGKSTLIRELVEPRKGNGEVTIGGVSRSWPHDPASLAIAYLPQDDLVHEDLTLAQQTRSLISLVNPADVSKETDEVLRAVGLFECKDRFPNQVSGGQLRRARFAAALGRKPGVLLLDEPDSGLDPETAEEIYRLIKTFQLLGCTIVMVTHHQHGLSGFDRVLELKNGVIVEDSLSSELMVSADVDLCENQGRSYASPPHGIRQFTSLLKREILKQKNRNFISWDVSYGKKQGASARISIPQWLLNLLLIPILFGVSIAVVSPAGDESQQTPYLVTFLCSLSFIWIAASNSNLCLTSEWKRIQFEKDQGLFPYLYLLSKSLILLLTVLVQSCSFWLALVTIRYWAMQQPILYGEPGAESCSDCANNLGEFCFENFDCGLFWMMGTMALVGWAASQMGLVISALARHRTHVATSVLPLVMMLQVLFSVFVIRAESSDQSLQRSYAGFYLNRTCEGAGDCPSHYLNYFRNTGFLCSSCIERVEERFRADQQKSDSDQDVQKLWSQAIREVQSETLSEVEIQEHKDDDEDENIPGLTATVVSYVTLTRYSDQALRSKADARCCNSDVSMEEDVDETAENYSYQAISWYGLCSLLGMGFIFHGLTAFLTGAVHPARFFGRIVTRLSSRTATRASLIATLTLLTPIALSAEEPKKSDNTTPIKIVLPVSDNQYDASAILSRNSHGEAQAPVWYPLTRKTRLALALMETQGLIESYSINEESIRIVVNHLNWKPLVNTISPPQLLGFDQSRKHDQLVILVHGLEGGLGSYRHLAPAFEAQGWFPLLLVYPNDAEISIATNYLKEQLLSISQRKNKPRIVIVGHSLGGIVSWSALTGLDSQHRVTDLVTLGTPFGGSQLAEFQAELELSESLIKILKGDWESQDLDSDGQGEAAQLLIPGNPELEKLISRPLPADVKLHLVAGTRGFILPERRTEMIQSMECLIVRKKPSEELAKKLRLLISADEIVQGLGDGAVTVKSATLPENSERILKVDYTHTEFLNDQQKISKLVSQIIGILEN
jgi:ABC-type multidrug transport system ATPase subunit/pimeloyl-ACP methyl ester carboxylesterase